MKNIKTTFLLLLIFLITQSKTYSQSEVLKEVEYKSIKDKLYVSFSLPGDTLPEYSIDSKNKFINLKKVNDFSQKNDITVYLRWLNPINFRVLSQDTLFDEPSAKVMDDFFTSVTSQFTILPISESNAFVQGIDKGEIQRFTLTDPKNANAKKLTEVGFHDLDLMTWYALVGIQYQRAATAKTDEQVKIKNMVDEFEKSLKGLDKYLVKPYKEEAGEAFFNLKSIDDPFTIIEEKGSFEKAKRLLQKLKNEADSAKKLIKELNIKFAAFKTLTTTSKEYENVSAEIRVLTLSTITAFEKKMTGLIASRDNHIQAILKLVELLEKSTSEEVEQYEGRLYKKISDITRERGKIKQIGLNLKVFTYNGNDPSTRIEKSHSSYLLKFHLYKFFIPVMSTGVFYSGLNLTSFEAGTDDQGNTIVDEIDANNGAVYAMMLNFFINTKHSEILPFIQFGVDPTKERPFLLVGGGIGVPRTKFAISGGLAWTWTQSLTTLSVGGAAESASEIRSDIGFKFDLNPMGYVGIQYEF